ncbi:MAG: tRNA lysidine(34) synthetase TilS [Flavobacteriales bacterium]
MSAESGSPEKSDRLRTDLLPELLELLEKSELSPEAGSLLLAVSGGVDSMVMLDLLHRSGHAGAVVHFDHGLRQNEGRMDQQLVKEESSKRELAFHPIALNLATNAPEKGLQHEARKARYYWLERIKEENGYGGIATAHHADDRLETVLMGILRGSGFRGVVGIPTENGGVIRPLNPFWKERLERYATWREIPYREDLSNRSQRFLRNRIRQKLLPSFRESFPEKEKSLLRSLDLLEESGLFLEEMGKKERERILEEDGKGGYRIPKKELRKSASPRVLLFEILRPFAFDPSRIGDLIQNLDGLPGGHIHAENWILIRDREELFVRPREDDPGMEPPWRIEDLDKPGKVPLRFEKKERPIERFKRSIPQDPHEVLLDMDKLELPLTLREVKNGDRFRPLGMKKGSKTVMEHLTDRKWPVHEKEKAMILCDKEGKIIWVIGSAIDERYRIDEETQQLLKVRYSGVSS